MSKIFSSISSGGVRAASSRPIRKCAVARSPRGDQRIGRLLDAIMEEGVAAVRAANQPRPDSFPERPVHFFLGPAMNEGEGRHLGDISQTGELSERAPSRYGQAAELRRHEIHHIVGEALGADARQVPAPAGRGGIESQKFLLRQGDHELDREERIAAGLLEHQLGQGSHFGPPQMQGIGQQPRHILRGERGKRDFLRPSPGLADPRQHPREGVRGADFIVPIGAQQQEMAHLLMQHEMLDQIERRPVQPLQIVEEQHQRMLGPSEDAEEAPEHQLKPILAILGGKIGDRRRLADDEGELRDQIDHEPAIGTKRFEQAVPPAAQLRVVLAEQLANETLECLSQRRVRDVALVLVELPAGEETPGGTRRL